MPDTPYTRRYPAAQAPAILRESHASTWLDYARPEPSIIVEEPGPDLGSIIAGPPRLPRRPTARHRRRWSWLHGFVWGCIAGMVTASAIIAISLYHASGGLRPW